MQDGVKNIYGLKLIPLAFQQLGFLQAKNERVFPLYYTTNLKALKILGAKHDILSPSLLHLSSFLDTHGYFCRY
jgi:hypothetical protein